MREIKFRVWKSKEKKMSPLAGIAFKDGKVVLLTTWDKDKPHSLFPEGNIVMQFTGLKDKNGKEIYFGDLVSFKGNSLTEGKVNKTIEIKDWSDVVCDFGLENAQDAEIELEVIGNIYESPELLK